MTNQSGSGRVGSAIQAALGGVAALFCRRPGWALLVAVALTALGGISGNRLRVDVNMANMLPRSFESVQNVERLKKQFGGVGSITVHVSNASPEVLRRFARDLAPKLEALPDVRYVEYQRPNQFFKDRALYYLEIPDLQTIYGRIRARTKWSKLRANPLYIDLEETPKPKISFTDIIEKYKKQDKGMAGTALKKKQELYYLDAVNRQLVLLVKPASVSTQINFVRKVVADVRRVIDAVDKRAYDPALKVQLCGRYTKRIEQQDAIEADLQLTSVLAMCLMLLYLGFHFRRVAAVALVIVPLVLGVVWTLGFAALLVDKLNLLSAFFGVILLGLGVDHGIHLLSRIQAEAGLERSVEDRVRIAFAETGLAVLIATVTTSVGFFGLSISEFRGFREFGQIAAAGTCLVALSYFLVLPALIGLLTRFKWQLSPLRRRSQRGIAGSALRLASPALWLVGVGFFLIMLNIPSARFEYNFSKLNRADLPSVKVDRTVDKILGRSQAPMVILTQTEAQATRVVAELRKRKEKKGSGIRFVRTTSDFIPKNQQAKRKIILKILAELRQVYETDFKGKARDTVKNLKKYKYVSPFELADLPPQVRRRFQSKDSTKPPQFVLVYASVGLSDGLALRKLARELRGIPMGDGQTISAAGGGMVLADVLDLVFSESPRVMAVTIAVIFLAISLMLGSVRRGLLCLVPAGITVTAVMGLMSIFGVKFNYLNVVIMPVLLGLGVDGGVHFVLRYRQTGDLPAVVVEVGRAVAGALLTTGLGFGALILAHHPGLSSFAKLAVIGLACNLLASLILLPALLALPQVLRQLRSASADGDDEPGLALRLMATVGLSGHGPLAPEAMGAVAAIPAVWGVWHLPMTGRIAAAGVVAVVAIVIGWRYLARSRATLEEPELAITSFAGVLAGSLWIPPFDLSSLVGLVLLYGTVQVLLAWTAGVGRRRLLNAPVLVTMAVLMALASGKAVVWIKLVSG